MKDDEINTAVRECIEGKKDSFSPIVKTFQEGIYRFCFHLLGSHEDAREATSEVFMKCYLALPTYDTHRLFPGWIFQIAYNHCIDLIRKKRREKKHIHFSSAPDRKDREGSLTVEERYVKNLEREKVRKALNELPPRFLTPLLLRYYFDRSYGEIAQIMDEPLTTVRVLIFRAKKELKKIIESET